MLVPFQVSHAGSPGFGKRRETPRFFSGGLIERGDKTLCAVVATAGAGNHQTAHGERRRRGAVILAPVRHLDIPHQQPVARFSAIR